MKESLHTKKQQQNENTTEEVAKEGAVWNQVWSIWSGQLCHIIEFKYDAYGKRPTSKITSDVLFFYS